MRPFRLPDPLVLAAEQLEQARRDLLNHEAQAEAYQAQANAEHAHAEMLRSRITRLEKAINQLKERHGPND